MMKKFNLPTPLQALLILVCIAYSVQGYDLHPYSIKTIQFNWDQSKVSFKKAFAQYRDNHAILLNWCDTYYAINLKYKLTSFKKQIFKDMDLCFHVVEEQNHALTKEWYITNKLKDYKIHSKSNAYVKPKLAMYDLVKKSVGFTATFKFQHYVGGTQKIGMYCVKPKKENFSIFQHSMKHGILDLTIISNDLHNGCKNWKDQFFMQICDINDHCPQLAPILSVAMKKPEIPLLGIFPLIGLMLLCVVLFLIWYCYRTDDSKYITGLEGHELSASLTEHSDLEDLMEDALHHDKLKPIWQD